MDTYKAAIRVSEHKFFDMWFFTNDNAEILKYQSEDIVYVETVEEFIAKENARRGLVDKNFTYAVKGGDRLDGVSWKSGVQVLKEHICYVGPQDQKVLVDAISKSKVKVVVEGAWWIFGTPGFGCRPLKNDDDERAGDFVIVTYNQKRAIARRLLVAVGDICQAARSLRLYEPIKGYDGSLPGYYDHVCYLYTNVLIYDAIRSKNTHRNDKAFRDLVAKWGAHPAENRKYALAVTNGDDLVAYCDWMDKEVRACKRWSHLPERSPETGVPFPAMPVKERNA